MPASPGLLTWAVVVTVINRVLRLSLPHYTAAEHTLQFTLGMKWARLLMAIVTSLVAGAVTGWISRLSRWGAVDRRQRGACNVTDLA
ncbi:MAG: hypothetical protein WB623_13000, partial [Candidatus Sulfotelmatobacter sp.]